MRVAGSGVERPAAGQSLPARRRARGSGESRGTERDRRPLSVSGEAGRKSARAELKAPGLRCLALASPLSNRQRDNRGACRHDQ